jgi:hypothetical protein
VKLPNVFAGMCLDRGIAGAYAIHLALIKLSHGPTFVLNETNLRNRFGVKRRAFRLGNRALRDAKLLDRSRNGGKASNGGRRFASEKWLVEAPDDRFVVPNVLIEKGPKAAGFYVAVAMSPKSMRPAEVGARIGLTSASTVRSILKQLVGHIAIDRPAKGDIRVARLGHIFDDVKKWPDKKVPDKNEPAHRRCKTSQKKEGRTPSKEPSLGEGTLAFASAAHEGVFEGGRRLVEPLYAHLTPWDANESTVDMVARCSYGSAITYRPADYEIMSQAAWTAWLERFGGAPAHLGQRQAYQEVTSLASSLASDAIQLTEFDAMVGIARALCREHAAGTQIRSLGVVAKPLARCVFNGYADWAHDLDESDLSDADLAASDEWVAWGIDVLKKRGVAVWEDRLQSTISREDIMHLVNEFGELAVEDAIKNTAMKGPVTDWVTFDSAAADACQARRRP